MSTKERGVVAMEIDSPSREVIESGCEENVKVES